MGILSAFLALLSCALIGAGVWLVVRDTRRGRAPKAAAGPTEPRLSGVRANLPGPLPPATDIDAPQATALPGGKTDPLFPSEALGSDLTAALRAVNGAFAPAGISLVCDTDDASRQADARPNLAVTVMAGHRRVGRLWIARDGEVVEITASSEETAADGVARSRRLSREEASIPSLAEAIAACAWPVATSVQFRK